MLATLILVAAALVPAETWAALPPLCPARWIGRRCPGCGMTRALALLLRGRLREALAINPRSAVVLPLLVWMSADWLRSVRSGR